jgi:pyruvate kinase
MTAGLVRADRQGLATRHAMEVTSYVKRQVPDSASAARQRAAATANGLLTRTRTRVVATIGPASDGAVMLRAMVAAGMDSARIPMAHGTIEDALARIRLIREVAPQLMIFADLPGPKIRSAPFPEGGVVLMAGDEVLLVPGSATSASSAKVIGVSHDELVADLQEDDTIAFGDGGVNLVVVRRGPEGVVAKVSSGGKLQGRPGVTVPASRVSMPSPTPEDFERLAAVTAEGVDGVAVSFVRSAEDILAVRNASLDKKLMLIAKIETAEGVSQLDQILEVTDAVMVARGDLGVRLPLEDVPHIQKQVIRACIAYGRPVITATQMLESMVLAPVPTRAEVADVANAVFDGTSAVMLSGETAVGVDPVNAVATMARVARRAEVEFDYYGWGSSLEAQVITGGASSPKAIEAAVTSAAWHAANQQGAAAIIACTRTGSTARAIARFRPSMPVLAATPSAATARQLALSWGVVPLRVAESTSTDEIVWFAVEAAVSAGWTKPGEVVVVLAGSPIDPQPVTDTMRLVRVR